MILLSPQGAKIGHHSAKRLAEVGRLILLCGRYEGIDERVREGLADEELSVGDVVLTGGELPAMMVIDAVSRFVPGVLGRAGATTCSSPGRALRKAPDWCSSCPSSEPERTRS